MLQVFYPTQGIRYTYGRDVNNLKSKPYSYYESDEHWLISDSPSELANAFSISTLGKTISPKDKIFFSKNCGYPSLLFSKLKDGGYNLDIIRTINSSKADKIVLKSNPIVKNIRSGYYLTTTNDGNLPRYCIYIPNLTDTQILSQYKNSLENYFNRKFYFGCTINDHESAELYLSNPSKAISSMDLIKYVNNFLPPMSDIELDMAITYLKSSDDQARKLGIEMFQYNNLNGQLYDVIKKILTEVPRYYIPNYSESSVAWKYLYTILQFDDRDFHNRKFTQNCSYFLRKVMKNPLNTANMDEIKNSIKQQLIDRLKTDPEFKELREDLELINCELIIHDKDGETASGN